MKRPGFLLIFIAVATQMSVYCLAQNDKSFDFDKSKKEMDARFDVFRRMSRDEFERKRGELNREYSEALSHIWSLREPEEPLEMPGDIPVPFPQMPDSGTDTVTFRIPDSVVNPAKPLEPVQPILLVRSADPGTAKEKGTTLQFFGVNCKFSAFPTIGIRLSGIDESSVAKVWDALLRQQFYDLVSECLHWKKQLNLNDWGYYLLAKYVSGRVVNEASA